MNTALGFGFGNALDPMSPRLKLQLRVDILPADADDDFLKAALFALAL